MNRKTAGLFAVAMAVGLVTAGLWPFDFRPPNHVNWLKDRAGLSFQPDSIAYDPEPTAWSARGQPDEPAAFTMELWLEPGRVPYTDLFDILTIDDGNSPPAIRLFQWKTELLLRVRDRTGYRGSREVGPAGVLIAETPRFITIAVAPAGTSFYSNGALLKYCPNFTVPNSQSAGRLILGNAAAGKHPWTGNLFGLALYRRALDTSAVAQHYALWTNNQAARLTAEPGLAALYGFGEGNGQWANDLSTNRHRLLIPAQYTVLQTCVLELPWGPDPIEWSDLDDVAINILGFVPFGFVACHYRRLARPDARGRNIVWAICIGAIISLAIELIQVWLPNRDSSATDLFCNTLGTFLGALLATKLRIRTFPAEKTAETNPV